MAHEGWEHSRDCASIVHSSQARYCADSRCSIWTLHWRVALPPCFSRLHFPSASDTTWRRTWCASHSAPLRLARCGRPRSFSLPRFMFHRESRLLAVALAGRRRRLKQRPVTTARLDSAGQRPARSCSRARRLAARPVDLARSAASPGRRESGRHLPAPAETACLHSIRLARWDGVRRHRRPRRHPQLHGRLQRSPRRTGTDTLLSPPVLPRSWPIRAEKGSSQARQQNWRPRESVANAQQMQFGNLY